MESHHFWDRSRKMNSQASLNYTVRYLSRRVNKVLKVAEQVRPLPPS